MVVMGAAMVVIGSAAEIEPPYPYVGAKVSMIGAAPYVAPYVGAKVSIIGAEYVGAKVSIIGAEYVGANVS